MQAHFRKGRTQWVKGHTFINTVVCLFQASYWTSKKCVVYGDVYDSEGTKVRHLFGTWNEAMFCGVEGEQAKCIWRVGKVRVRVGVEQSR